MSKPEALRIESLAKCMADALAVVLKHRQGVIIALQKDENNLNEPYGKYLVWKDMTLVRVMPYTGLQSAGAIIYVDDATANECRGSC